MPVRLLLIVLLLISPALAQRKAMPALKEFQTPYYVIHTDLTGDQVKEAALRMTKMAEEYRARTRDFAGAMNQKLPFFLFGKEQDYYDAGGEPGTAGLFDPSDNWLMAMADAKESTNTWHVIQHEGFHQFAASVIGGQLPTWVNEGLAEYFGEGLFTGDGFVTGIVPPHRLARVKQELREKQFRAIKEMMLLAHSDWNAEITLVNYDQAWSMVQFLAHAESGKYQSAFVSFMRAIGRGQQWESAWLRSFGTAEGFEQKWREYWLSLGDDPTAALYARATTMTLTSVLARATAQKQKFATFDDFAAAARAKQLNIDPLDWLPPALIDTAFSSVAPMRKHGIGFALMSSSGTKGAAITCTLSDGTKLNGRFRLQNGRVAEVVVDALPR